MPATIMKVLLSYLSDLQSNGDLVRLRLGEVGGLHLMHAVEILAFAIPDRPKHRRVDNPWTAPRGGK
jgi:hypothetical protein